jgi:RimJ/RimL family protein N-acetyltransferase
MKDPIVLELTASEPLSFEEEIEMQQSWRDDPKKCTFIVLSADQCLLDDQDDDTECVVSAPQNLDAMVGDVNLFLSDMDDDEDDEENPANKNNYPQEERVQAEIDIMIADKSFQRQGLGRAATCSMLLYGATKLGIFRFFCKINEENKASIQLFESLGFKQCAYAECFKEVELELIKSPNELQKLLGKYGEFQAVKCPF